MSVGEAEKMSSQENGSVGIVVSSMGCLHHVTSYGETWQAPKGLPKLAYSALPWYEHF